MNIGLIGAGAVGLFYGAHLAKVGHQITIITRQIDVYQDSIKIDSCDGNFKMNSYQVLQLGQIPIEAFDIIILATKVLNTIDFVSLIKPYMSKKTILLMIQNGIFYEDKILETYQQQIFRGLAFIFVNRLSKTHIQHIDYGALTIGPMNQISDNALLNKFMGCFNNINFKFNYTNEIWTAIWEKMMWNVPFNPLSVIYGGVTTDELVNSIEICNRVRCIMKEVYLAATAFGIVLPENIIDYKIEQTKKMTSFKTSMCIDYFSGAPLEIEAIVGNLVQFCNNKKLKIPNLKTLYNDLKAI